MPRLRSTLYGSKSILAAELSNNTKGNRFPFGSTLNLKAIGIDIGGTKISVAAIDVTGNILSKASFPTEPDAGFERAVGKMSNAIRELTQDLGWRLDEFCGIGIGCTGPVDTKRGTVHNPYTLPTWDNGNLITSFEDRLGIRVRLENDADAAALGEFHFGSGKGADPMVMLTFGTGIGFSALVDGRIVRGVHGAHPEMGHIPILPNGPKCYCGTRGCFESLASGPAIELAGRHFGFTSTRAVFDAAQFGDANAQQIIDRALFASATAAWTIIHTYLPKRIILGGGIMQDHFDLFAKAMHQSIENAVLIPQGEIEIAKATLGAAAGVVGAASLVM